MTPFSSGRVSRRNLSVLAAGLARPLPASVRESASGRRRDRGDLDRALARVAASGHPPESASALADLWPDLDPPARSQIATPLRPGPDGFVSFGSRRATQAKTASCGPAVLVVLLAAGDPVVATWLVTGRRLGSLPREIAAVAGTAAASEVEGAPGARFVAAQEAMLRAANRHAFGGLPWPSPLGTPPWTAARHARFPGVRYSARAVNDANVSEMERLLAWVRASLARGVPVPLYAGGDLVRGVSTAVPRHVVLAVPPPLGAPPVTISLYEPGSAQVHDLVSTELVTRSEPHPALGGWTHVCWAVLPRAVRTPAGAGASGLRLPS